MSKVFALVNQKGGVGKSTTTINLSACLVEAGKNVLVIDIDPQGNTTSGFGVDKNDQDKTIYDILIDEESCLDVILHLEEIQNQMNTPVLKLGKKRRKKTGVLHLIPSNVNLAGAEVELIDMEDKEYILRNALKEVRDNYDYIMIDCPPSLSLLTINALTAADKVLVPIQCEYYALEGLAQLLQTIDLVQNGLNEDLDVSGIVFTMYDSRNNLSPDVVQNVKDNFPNLVFDTLIPRNVRLAEAPSYGLPINLYDSRSTGAESYRKLAKELITKEGKTK